MDINSSYADVRDQRPVRFFGYPLSDISSAVVIFVVALAIRAAVYLSFGGDRRIGDEMFYWHFAHSMLDGRFSTAHYMPGWPLLLSVVLRVSDSFRALQMFTILLGSLECVFASCLANRAMDRKSGFLAGLLMSFYPEHVFMSHRIAAEAGLGVVLAGIALLIFWNAPAFPSRKRTYVIAFLFGVALLLKHFAVLGFAAFFYLRAFRSSRGMRDLLSRRRIWDLLLMTALFFLPVALFSTLFAPQKDAAIALRAPFKSMQEWHVNRIGPPPAERNVRILIEHYGEATLAASPRYIFERADENALRLWGTSSHPLRRISEGGYPPLSSDFPTDIVFKAFYVAILLAGLTGLCLAPRSLLRTYAIICLVLLTAMCFQFWMSGRYHLPFMFLLTVFAARVLAKPRNTLAVWRTASVAQKSSWALLMLVSMSCVVRTW